MPRFVKLATLSELPEGSAAEVEFEGRVYALYNINGVISAIDGICPHQGGPLAEGLSRARLSPARGTDGNSTSAPGKLRWAPRSSSLSTKLGSTVRMCWSRFLEPLFDPDLDHGLPPR